MLKGKANLDIRSAINNAGIKAWQVADALGMHDSNFSKLLRKELPRDIKVRILAVVTELKNNQAC